MATTHHPGFDFRMLIPLADRGETSPPYPARPDKWREATNNSDQPKKDSPISSAIRQVLEWRPVDGRVSSDSLPMRLKAVSERVNGVARSLRKLTALGGVAHGKIRTISDNLSTIKVALADARAGIEAGREFPHWGHSESQFAAPRPFILASTYLDFNGCQFDENDFAEFVIAIQKKISLKMSEVWNLRPFLEFVVLEKIGNEISEAESFDCHEPAEASLAVEGKPNSLLSLVGSLQKICDLDWKSNFEAICEAERVLRNDPLGAYEEMDWESREAYRAALTNFAAGANCSETQVAQEAVILALAAHHRSYLSERARERRSHVGYYLVDAGRDALKRAIEYQASPIEAVRETILKWSVYFYLIGIELITLAGIALLISSLHVQFYGFLALALIFLPAVGCAVATMNVLAIRLFPPKRLPKLDFSKGIPDEYATVVVVPALLTSEEQTRLAVQALEIRFLANRDPNLHFVLLTDPPDSTRQFDDKDALAPLCSKLVNQLNVKYGPENKGMLFHFHRHRAYNASEGLWMGWERKRGKLLEFNRFLLNQGDNFSIKTGDWSVLAKKVRYVITLDLDTQLPPGAARRLVGAMAHPLNRAVLDPTTDTVTEGYGILQPRVDISTKSATRSHFASLLSGDTGFDMYTRAVSDVYQDLFGEAIFTGKGIYEVETFQKVLEHRFPCNAVLSHDLIEGVYARTGLVSDVEVVDDYPSHFSASSRRTHRWIRGDWQILFGLLPRVRNFYGQLVRNPLSHISRWKILDNLRRSMMDFATLLVLLYGWFFRPAVAAYWTLAAIGLMVFPMYFQFVLAIFTAGGALFTAQFWKNVISDLASSQSRLFLKLIFLLQQTLVEIDAVVRTLVRMTLTRRRLLEWETAADAELGTGRKSIVDTYLKCCFPISMALGTLIYLVRPRSLPVALPFLILWGSSKWICAWLNRPQRPLESKINKKDRAELRQMALRTWRFFREFSNAAENWLIPDIVKEAPPLVAHRVSPTNLGLLLDARIAAVDLGILTLPEFIRDTERTFETVSRMPKCRGHLYNWYATDTLKPVEPLFVSSVDSGNLLCSLWTLKQGCLEAIKQPLCPPAFWEGIRDHVELLTQLVARSCVDGETQSAMRELSRHTASLSPGDWCQVDHLESIKIDTTILLNKLSKCDGMEEAEWWAQELIHRVTHLLKLIEDFVPWLLPEFAFHRLTLEGLAECPPENLTLESLPQLYQEMSMKLRTGAGYSGTVDPSDSVAGHLALALDASIRISQGMVRRLTALASSAQSMAEQMDFNYLFDPKKKLLSIGYDKAEEKISTYHYDLLASEARAAVFGAIAKNEIPLESWFQLRRSYRMFKGEPVLLSWTGTAFEYLMPSLWIRAYPETLLDRSARAAIRAQQRFAKANSVPWGISESSCIERNPDGHYRYHAFGVPGLAVHQDDCSGDLVVAPYATFLGLQFVPLQALKNLRKMKELGWLSPYGFYEAADFTPRRIGHGQNHEVVRNWMAHHQAMSLVAIANVLCDFAMQRRFHAEPAVAAAERLLNERYPRVMPVQDAAAEASEADSTLAAMAQQMLMHPEFRSLSPKLS
jgi:cyclic beta-1,2-glucan glucanotransferase